MAANHGGYIKWNAEEWLRVAVYMLPRLDKGESNYVALANAQRRALPKNRQQNDKWVGYTTQPKRSLGLLAEKLKAARMLTDEQRALFMPQPAAQPVAADVQTKPGSGELTPKGYRKQSKPDTERKLARAGTDKGRKYKGARWTTLEWALIARMVKWFKTHGVSLPLSRLVIEAQELVLDADRRRSIPGIQASVAGDRLVKSIAEATGNIYLVSHVPFNPPLPPGAEPEAAAQPQEAAQTAPEATTAPPPLQTVPQSELTPQAGSIRDAMHAAAEAFGATMMQALDTLLQTNTELVMREMQQRLEAQAATMAANVATLVETGMRRAVHRMMEQELGGNIAPPADAPSPPLNDGPRRHNPEPTPSLRVERIKVDVVGLNNGSDEQLIAKAFNPGEIDLRFTRPTESSSYQPSQGRHCIVMSERIPHAISYKIKAAKVDPIYVKPTAGHIIHAIEELQRAHTAQVAH
jgi:hypothetical protein